MLTDKQEPASEPCQEGVAIGWFERGTAVPDAWHSLLRKEDYVLCHFSGGEESARSGIALVVLDCSGLDAMAVQKILAALYAQNSSLRIALWDVEPGMAPESLMRWPGVKGVLRADAGEAQLRKGLSALLAGETWLPRRMMEEWLEQQRSRFMPVPPVLSDTLTERERQILNRVGEASTNAQIAYDLCISEHTVKTHLYNIYRKIKVRNRTEACNWIRGNFQLAGL